MEKMDWKGRFARRWFGTEIRAQVRAALAAGDEAVFGLGTRPAAGTERDRLPYDREEVLEQSLQAWRVNPLARRIVELTSQYVVGGGITLGAAHPETAHFLNAFWEHPLNRMAVRCAEWCDELTRTGNLFILLTSDASGMSYVRAFPASAVAEIETQPNDVEQPRAFLLKPAPAELETLDGQRIPAYQAETDSRDAAGNFPAVMLHYAINRPAGAAWGEPDLAPLLRWLARYANWLEDRARLNRYRTAFLYVVRSRFQSEAERAARQAQLNACPPSPGSILVTDEAESWEILSAKLDAVEASADGLALKKMIAAGAGVPLHFLAEPESATRTTAEAAGGPTYRRFEQRQKFFLWMLSDLLSAVLRRRAAVDRRTAADAEFSVQGADISARDNVAYGLASAYINNIFGELRDRGLIDSTEYLRMVYRFCGEAADVDELLTRAQALAETYGAKSDLYQKLERWGAAFTANWLTFLEHIGNAPASSPPFYSRARWALDTWDALQEEP